MHDHQKRTELRPAVRNAMHARRDTWQLALRGAVQPQSIYRTAVAVALQHARVHTRAIQAAPTFLKVQEAINSEINYNTIYNCPPVYPSTRLQRNQLRVNQQKDSGTCAS